MQFYLCVILINLFLSQIFACEFHKSCDDCIRDVNKCIWCADDKYTTGPKCKSEASLGDWCLGNTINPKSTLNVTQELEFSSNKSKIIQMKPQKMKMKLRPGESLDFEFSYKRVKDYPIDVYFLLDGSLSMKIVKESTVNQSKYIYNMLYNMTNDIYLGMGSFVDKNALPYTDVVNSTYTYSFKNRLSLTANYEEFQKVLSDTEFGQNFDEPESVLDALAQVMVCTDEIGWRNQTRKIIVVITDASYHAAGDGQWAGIIQPYDGKCHTQNGTYTKELEMDYPTISIINILAAREEILTVFAVTNEIISVYEPFTKLISGAYVASYEDEKISSILGAIYNGISDSIKLKVDMKPKYRNSFDISFDDCYTDKCILHINEEKKIKGSIKLLEYLDDDDIQINVKIESLLEKLTLDLNVIKECVCNTEKNSSSCTYGGARKCGVCECDPGRYGSICECSYSSVSNPDDTSACIAPNSTEVCSGLGFCHCGECQCTNSIYKGQFCECNTQRCLRDADRNLCSNNGECGKIKCGECACYENWSGDDCSCSMLQTKCIDKDTKVCNGRGVCECNGCKCPSPAQWDARIEQDLLCKPMLSNQTHSRQCIKLHPCVLGYLKQDESNCKEINISAIGNLNDLNDTIDWEVCPDVRVDVGCYTTFLYRYNEDQYEIEVLVQTKLNCAESYYMFGGSCLVTLIIIGIITLVCWKYITHRKDKAEYERFYKQLQSQDTTSVNPIYSPATTSFENPAFRRSSRH